MNDLIEQNQSLTPSDEMKSKLAEAISSWLLKSPSLETRSAYKRELGQFLKFIDASPDDFDQGVFRVTTEPLSDLGISQRLNKTQLNSPPTRMTCFNATFTVRSGSPV